MPFRRREYIQFPLIGSFPALSGEDFSASDEKIQDVDKGGLQHTVTLVFSKAKRVEIEG